MKPATFKIVIYRKAVRKKTHTMEESVIFPDFTIKNGIIRLLEKEMNKVIKKYATRNICK